MRAGRKFVSAVSALAITFASGADALAKKPVSNTVTPIQHVVVIFQENVSFDHYFATYPVAANPSGDPQFSADPATPTVNGLTPSLLTKPNWDDLDEAAKWSRANADVLKDARWIGGDPAGLEVYGWASWAPR